MSDTIIQVNNLHTNFHTDAGLVQAVNGVSFDIPKGKTVAIVGESGSGKSVTALSIMGLIQGPQGRIESGEILLGDRDLLKLSNEEMREVRSRDISMIFQEPMTSLNPGLTIGYQVEEVYRRFLGLGHVEAQRQTLKILEEVDLPRPDKLIHAYPYELSGGQRQRVMIAMALASSPKLLIADEPTTALDVTIQYEVLQLMMELQEKHGTSILIITHDLGVVAEIADEVLVMYAGRVVEQADVFEIFDHPKHPYTQGLLKARPTMENRDQELYNIPGNVPNPINLKEECHFANRCPHTMEVCRQGLPPYVQVRPHHIVACELYRKGEER